MTNQKPHNSLTASWNGRSRGCSKIRGNRITYPLIFMTSSNINFLSVSLSLSLPLFFLSSRAIPPGSSFPKHVISSRKPLLSPFPFAPFTCLTVVFRLSDLRVACLHPDWLPESSHSPKNGYQHPEYNQHHCQHTNPKTRCISIEPPPVGDFVLFLFFLFFFFFFLFFLVHPCISFRTLIRVPPQAKAALQDNRAVT